MYVVFCCEPWFSTMVVAKSKRHAVRLFEAEKDCRHGKAHAKALDWKRRGPLRAKEPAFFAGRDEIRAWLPAAKHGGSAE